MMRTVLIVSTALLLTSFQSVDGQEAIPAADAYRMIRDMENFGPHYQDAEKSSIGVNLWEVGQPLYLSILGYPGAPSDDLVTRSGH